MPAKRIYENPLRHFSGYMSSEEIHIHLYNRILALEEQVKRLEKLMMQQCEYCQYRKVAENVKSILS